LSAAVSEPAARSFIRSAQTTSPDAKSWQVQPLPYEKPKMWSPTSTVLP
jgi:hypothetical protein